MHKGLEISPSPLLGVENPFGESFYPFESDETQCGLGSIPEDSMAEASMYGSSFGSCCSGSWGEDFQSLSPFGADWEMEQEFFKSDLSCFDSESCKTQGPTLAELNDQRSLSPLINPEMERLHRIATRTELEPASSVGTAPFARRLKALSTESAAEKPTETKVAVDIKKEKCFESEEGNLAACEFAKRGFVAVRVKQEPQTGYASHGGSSSSATTATATTTQNTEEQEEEKTIELSSCDIMKRILMERKYEVKSPVPLPKLVSPEMKSQLYETGAAAQGSRETTLAHEQERVDFTNEDENMGLHDDSADEDMDSEDDFDDREEDNPTRSRKGRRSDTDDLIPNPRKLLDIGRELNRLNKVIGDLKPIHSLPLNARNKSRKEKNKLASRACRLKKKAQHEANKLKLHGLELEQQRLVQVIDKVRSEIVQNTEGYTEQGCLSSKVESMVCNVVGKQVVAGHTSEFIESVLKATAQARNPKLSHLDIHLDI